MSTRRIYLSILPRTLRCWYYIFLQIPPQLCHCVHLSDGKCHLSHLCIMSNVFCWSTYIHSMSSAPLSPLYCRDFSIPLRFSRKERSDGISPLRFASVEMTFSFSVTSTVSFVRILSKIYQSFCTLEILRQFHVSIIYQ